MDKVFITLGFHRFWSYVAFKLMATVGSFCVFIYVCSQVQPPNFVAILLGYLIIFVIFSAYFWNLMEKPLKPQTLSYLNEQLLSALIKESMGQVTQTPVTWFMVVQKVEQLHHLNAEAKKSRFKEAALVAQKAWVESKKA